VGGSEKKKKNHPTTWLSNYSHGTHPPERDQAQ
jgi:hypothetical protein